MDFPVLDLLAFRRAKFMMENPSYINAWNTNLTAKLDAEILDRMKYNLNFIIEIIGETGSGKTEVGFAYNLKCQQALGYHTLVKDNFTFTYTEGLKISQKYPERWTLQIDEQVRSYYGEGSKRELSAMQDLEDTVRASQSNFIYVSPSHRSFHSGLHYIFRTWWLDYQNETNYCLVFEPTDTNLRNPIGFITVPRPAQPEYLLFLKAYQLDKKAFIQQVKNQGTRVSYFKEKAEDSRIIAKKIRVKDIPKLTKKKILGYITLHEPEIASKYGISELSGIADMVKMVIDES